MLLLPRPTPSPLATAASPAATAVSRWAAASVPSPPTHAARPTPAEFEADTCSSEPWAAQPASERLLSVRVQGLGFRVQDSGFRVEVRERLTSPHRSTVILQCKSIPPWRGERRAGTRPAGACQGSHATFDPHRTACSARRARTRARVHKCAPHACTRHRMRTDFAFARNNAYYWRASAPGQLHVQKGGISVACIQHALDLALAFLCEKHLKACERGARDPPHAQPLGRAPARSDARLHASDAHLHASDARLHASDARLHASDARLHASDARLHASDARLHASDAHLHASDGVVHITPLPALDQRGCHDGCRPAVPMRAVNVHMVAPRRLLQAEIHRIIQLLQCRRCEAATSHDNVCSVGGHILLRSAFACRACPCTGNELHALFEGRGETSLFVRIGDNFHWLFTQSPMGMCFPMHGYALEKR
eukprot:363931-Chlamydomonas_euryale.AAC.12